MYEHKKLLIIVGIVIVIAIIVNESRFIIWGPFGIPEQKNTPNCGEDRYKFDVTINSKEDFVNLLKNNKLRGVTLDGFKDIKKCMEYTDPEVLKAEINWSEVLSSIKVEENNAMLLYQKIYRLDYSPDTCPGSAPSLTLKVTSLGYVSVAGCAGK